MEASFHWLEENLEKEGKDIIPKENPETPGARAASQGGGRTGTAFPWKRKGSCGGKGAKGR